MDKEDSQRLSQLVFVNSNAPVHAADAPLNGNSPQGWMRPTLVTPQAHMERTSQFV